MFGKHLSIIGITAVACVCVQSSCASAGTLPIDNGVYVSGRAPCAAAHILKNNDVATFNGESIDSPSEVRRIVKVDKVGAELDVTVDSGHASEKQSVFRIAIPDRRTFVVESDGPKDAFVGLYRFCSASDMAASPALKGLDFVKKSYDGEEGLEFLHNESKVWIFEKHGLIVYAEPKPSILGTIHAGDVLFKGSINAHGIIDGDAYVFKAGCEPLAYHVSGPAYVNIGDFTLRGKSPVRDKASCGIAKWTQTGANTKLDFIPGENESD